MVTKLFIAAAVSVLVILFGMPNIEQSRFEARSHQALILARQIQNGTLPPSTPDPWGNDFLIHNGSSPPVVTSRGVNGTTPVNGYDSDDVSTSMSTPPAHRIGQQKRRQVALTLAVSVVPWLVLFGSVVVARIRRNRSSVPNTAV